MGDFEVALEFTLAWEGGTSDHASDQGGLTKYGISQRSYPALDVLNLTLEKAKLIYLRDYWNPIRGSELPHPVALVLFDLAVNSGVRTASRALQRVLNVQVDGIIGPKTLAAALQKDSIELAKLIIDSRIKHLSRLVSSNTSQLAFLYGWMRRCAALSFEVGRLS